MTFSLIFSVRLKARICKKGLSENPLTKKIPLFDAPKVCWDYNNIGDDFFLNNLIYLHSTTIIFGSVCFLEDPNFLDVS